MCEAHARVNGHLVFYFGRIFEMVTFSSQHQSKQKKLQIRAEFWFRLQNFILSFQKLKQKQISLSMSESSPSEWTNTNSGDMLCRRDGLVIQRDGSGHWD